MVQSVIGVTITWKWLSGPYASSYDYTYIRAAEHLNWFITLYLKVKRSVAIVILTISWFITLYLKAKRSVAIVILTISWFITLYLKVKRSVAIVILTISWFITLYLRVKKSVAIAWINKCPGQGLQKRRIASAVSYNTSTIGPTLAAVRSLSFSVILIITIIADYLTTQYPS